MYNKQALLIIIFFISSFSTFVSAQSSFIRGDSNHDNKVDISDSSFIYNYLFQGGTIPECEDAADINDDGKIDITDPVYLNNYLYRAGPKPPEPYPNPGQDITKDELSCSLTGEGAKVTGDVFINGAPTSICNEESVNINIQGFFSFSHSDLTDFAKNNCLRFGEITTKVRIELFEDDIIGDEQIASHKSDIIKVPCSASPATFNFNDVINDIDLGRQAGGLEGTTIEVYAVATLIVQEGPIFDTGSITEKASNNIDILNNCQCSPKGVSLVKGSNLQQGSCCTNSRPYQFKPNGAQPTGEVDSYICKGQQSPTETQTIQFDDNTCTGNSATEKTTSNNIATCGTCEYCQQGDRRCRLYNGKEVCDTTDCDTKDTDCRDYQDVDSFCIRGACIPQLCSQYTDQSEGTTCNNGNGRCDGSGSCIDCQTKREVLCIDNDEHWAKVCGNVKEPQGLKRDCGEDSCSIRWFPYCDGNDLRERRDCTLKGCSDSKCFADEKQETRFVKTCENGCGNNKCKPDPNVACFSNGDCPRKESAPYCSDGGNILIDYTDYKCINQGQQNSFCEKVRDGKTSSECLCGCSNGQCISSCPSCTDGIKNQDETDIDCGGSCSLCLNEKSCKSKNDCQSDYCNPSTSKCESPPQPPKCQNECPQNGATQCSSLTTQHTCGNYDSDSCLEWGGGISCQFGCANNQCQTNQNQPDLIVSALVKQFPVGNPLVNQNIVLGFTIQNQGKTAANNVFWKAITGTNNFEQSNKVPLLINTGKSATVFILTSYSKAGTYKAKITADPNNKVEELNEDNNEKTIQIIAV